MRSVYRPHEINLDAFLQGCEDPILLKSRVEVSQDRFSVRLIFLYNY